MAGERWGLRTTESYDIYDGLWYAEPIFHITDFRLGIMDDVFLAWFPLVEASTTDFLIADNYRLTGKNSPISMHWLEEDTLTFVNLHPNHPYVENEEIPSPILTITETEQRIFKAAADEKLNKGYHNSLEDFTVQYEATDPITILPNTTTNSLKPHAGNGFLWVKNADERLNATLANVGSLDNSFAIKAKNTAFQTWHVVGKNAIGFSFNATQTVSNNLVRGLGYRSWCYTPNIENKKLTFSMVVDTKAVPGFNFLTRIGYPGNWQFFVTHKTTDGQEQFVFHFDPTKIKEENRGKPLCIDWFYDCYYDQATFPYQTSFDLVFDCLTVHEGHWSIERLNPAFASHQEHRQFSAAYGFHEKQEYAYKPNGEIIFNRPLVSANYRLHLTSLKTMSVSKTRYGFSYTSNAEPDEEWSFTYSAKVADDVSDVV